MAVLWFHPSKILYIDDGGGEAIVLVLGRNDNKVLLRSPTGPGGRTFVRNIQEYRASKSERTRTADLVRILPKGRHSVLDIGARDGHFSRILTGHFESVTALDLEEPSFDIAGVTTVAGDVTKLDIADDSFDCVFCAEVLEHVPDIERAAAEIARVAKHEIVIGVPFKQDTRCARTTCQRCGKTNPPWGHVNSFDEERLSNLFVGLPMVSKSFVGLSKTATNPLSTFLMDLAGHPWGTYEQEEPCGHCGAKLILPADRQLWQRVCSAVANNIDRLQAHIERPHGNWIHVVFSKRGD